MTRLCVPCLAVLLCGLAAGCGSHSALQTTTATSGKACASAKAALAEIQADIAAMRKAAALPTASILDGNHAINVATDRFLHDVELAPITNVQRNRLIDHAASASSAACQQCFQALEAERPIPAIRQGDTHCGG